MAENTPLKNLIIGFLAFTVLFAGCMYLVYNVSTVNPSMVDTAQLESMNNTFNKLSEMEAGVDELKAKSLDIGDTGNPIADFLATLFNTAWNGLTSIATTFSFGVTMIIDAGGAIGLPWWVTLGGSVLITLVIVFSTLSVVFNREF